MEKIPAYEETPTFDESTIAPEVKRLASYFNLSARRNGLNDETMQKTVELYAGTVGDVTRLKSRMLTTDAQAYFRYKVLETVSDTHNVFMAVGIKAFNEQIEAAKKLEIIPKVAIAKISAT